MRAKSTEQAAAAQGDDAPAPILGSLASRAAALIAGQDDPAPQGDDDAAGDAAHDTPPLRGPARDDEPPDEPEQPAEGDEEGEADDGDGGDAPPASLDDVAKRLGMTRQEFNAIPVQVGGDTLTLGELKAKLPELARLDKDREALDDERGNWELERVASYRNINAIVDQLPRGAITQGVLRQLEQQHENTRNRELENLHFARPRWADPTYSEGARQKILAVAKSYGFSRVEIEGLMDHRFILWAQDDAELREKVKQSRDAARKVNEPSLSRANGQGAARGATDATYTRPRPKQSQAERIAAVGALMRRR